MRVKCQAEEQCSDPNQSPNISLRVRVHSLRACVTLGPNMLAHVHAKEKEHGMLVLGNSYMSSDFIHL